MKVLQIAPVGPPHRSGIANAAGNIAAATAKAGADVSFCSAIGGGEIAGVTVLKDQSIRLPGLGFLAWTPNLLKRLVAYDFIHLHFPCFGNAMLVHLARFLGNKKPLVVSYHMDVFGRGLRKPVFAAHAKWFLPRFLSHADKIVVASRDYAESSLLKDHPELMKKVVEIPFGIDVERFRSDTVGTSIRDRHGLTASDKVILFVGGLDEAHYFKGLHYLMESLVVIPGAKLLVVGSGNLLKEYAQKANELEIAERVIFAGKVSNSDLAAYYASANVFCLPSVDRSEAFGLVLTEAAASGVPQVATTLPGVRTVVKEGETGFLVPPKDVSALAAALRKILENPEEAQRMGQAARRFAETLTWEKAGDLYVELYRSILR